ADRIELCQALQVGGLTPSAGLIKWVKKYLDIPVYMLIRPRAGDFVYSPEEILVMEEDIHAGISLGIDGFVTGALRYDGRIDKEVCSKLISAANGAPVTFHRAFDVTSDKQSLQDVIDLGFKRILTSGHCKTAHEGILTIRKLINDANSRIIIMPGSGITPRNLKDIIDITGAAEFHSSCQSKTAVSVNEESVVQGTTFYPVTSVDVVKEMKDILRVRLGCYNVMRDLMNLSHK
ncbi:copper homeostasis protein cutC homolog, partial [Caerostris extrusa]